MKKSNKALRDKIIQLREAIRYHRDQRGDDRCWLDDFLIWKLLSDTPTEPQILLPYEECMKRCREFYTSRRAENPDLALLNSRNRDTTYDQDLREMNEAALQQELRRLEECICKHRDIKNRVRTLEDDRLLYQALPEQIPADFRLPSEEAFLGTAQQNAGCPNFWKSHGNCQTEKHNFTLWGPCKNK